jgi:hypothetical protein
MFSGGYVDITPASSMALSGFGERWKWSTSVADPIEANVIVLRHNSSTIAFVQLDVLSAGNELRHRIIEGLGGLLKEEELFLVASHTHFAPGIDFRLSYLGIVRPEYVAMVAEKVTELLRSVLLSEGQPASLRYGEREAGLSVNRRHWCLAPRIGIPPIKRVMAWHPNWQGKTDDVVRAFTVAGPADDSPARAVLWNYTCHAVSNVDFFAISADYPGVVRRAIRSQFGQDMPVVFLPGFSGDVNPNNVDRFPLSPYYLLHRIVNGPVFRRSGRGRSRRWQESLGKVVLATLAGPSRAVPIAGIRTGRHSEACQKFMDGEVDNRPLNLQFVAFDEFCVFLGVSAEVVVEYADKVRELFPNRLAIPIGYIDGACGYIPTPEMLIQGGLETSSPGYLLTRAHWRTDVAERLLNAIRQLTTAVH